MAKTKVITRPLLRELSGEVVEALSKLTKKYGIEFSYTGASFSSIDFTMRIKGAIPKTEAQAESENISQSKLLGFNTNVVGEKLTIDNQKYLVIGLLPNRRKYPLEVQNIATGKVVITTTSVRFDNKKIKNFWS